MTFALARSLLLADAVKPEALAQALLVSATRGTSLVRALLAARAIDPVRLDQQLERGDAPYMRHVAPVLSLVQQLPPELCERLLALPVRRDPRTGTIDVAVVDARDPHPVEEIAHWLKAPVRMVRTSLVTMEAALRQLHAKPDAGMRPLAAPMWVPSTGAEQAAAADAQNSKVDALVGPAPNIPIPLMRKSIVPLPIVEIGPAAAAPAVERDPFPETHTDPILDLRRLKPATPALADGAPNHARDLADDIPPAPATTRGPFSPNAPSAPFDDLSPTLGAIRGATERDAILELLVTGVRTVARRVAVFAVKRDLLVGWTCSPEMGDRAVLRTARMVAPPDSVLSTAMKRDDALLARIPKDSAHAPVLAAMHATPAAEVALVGVRVDGKPVALVIADELGDTLIATRRMEEIARAAGESFARLLREKRK
jgi:Type II secretion system (T2SS), protein E, N-terminal domain